MSTIVRLDLSAVSGMTKKPYVCILVDFHSLPTIRDFKSHVVSRFDIDGKVEFYIDDKFLVPSDESTHILKFCEVIQVQIRAKKGKRVRSSSPEVKKIRKSQENIVTSGSLSLDNKTLGDITPIPDAKNLEDPETSDDSEDKPQALKVNGDHVDRVDDIVHAKENPESIEVNGNGVGHVEDILDPIVKKRRKRKRKNKNKNRLVNAKGDVSNDIELNNHVPESRPKVMCRRNDKAASHTYFDDNADENEVDMEVGLNGGEVEDPATVVSNDDDVEQTNGDVHTNNNPDDNDRSNRIVGNKRVLLEKSSGVVSCEDILLGTPEHSVSSPRPSSRKGNDDVDLSALLGLAKSSPIVTSRKIAEKDICSNKSVILQNPNGQTDVFTDISRYSPMTDDVELKSGQHLAFQCLQMGSDYTPGLVQFIGEVVSINGSTAQILVLVDGRDGQIKSGKFEIDDVMSGLTMKNQVVEFNLAAMTDKRLFVSH